MLARCWTQEAAGRTQEALPKEDSISSVNCCRRETNKDVATATKIQDRPAIKPKLRDVCVEETLFVPFLFPGRKRWGNQVVGKCLGLLLALHIQEIASRGLATQVYRIAAIVFCENPLPDFLELQGGLNGVGTERAKE